MLTLDTKLATQVDAQVDGVLCLVLEVRQKSRFRATLTDDTDVGVIVARGSILRDGDLLTGPESRVIRIEAAPEAVSIASHNDPIVLAQAAYHLGNRHVLLQIGGGWLRYLRDHVLDDLCRQLGIHVLHENAPFEPIAGAYGSAGHQHE